MLIDKIYLTESNPTQLVSNNIEQVNTYFDLHIASEEILPAVLHSYFVDYYLSQVMSGGIAQFAHSSQWRSAVMQYVEFGLAEMGATEHLELLDEIADVIMQDIGIDNFISFTQQNFSVESEIKTKLNTLNDKFFTINARQNLSTLNQDFLQTHPQTVFVSFAEFQTILSELKQNPVLQEKQNQHLANLPSYERYILRLCEQYGCELIHIMDRESDDENWHFFTSRGRFFMVENGDDVLMMTYRNPEIVASLSKQNHNQID